MRTRLVNLLLLAALLYSAARLWQFLGEPPPALPTIEIVAPQPDTDVAPREQPGVASNVKPETYDVIVARDLFSPSRGVVPPAPAAAAAPAAPAQPPPKLTLYGVVIIDGEKTAFIQEGNKEGRPQKVREKQSFAGGTLSAIRPDGVTFLFAGREVIVPLRTPKEGAAVSGQEPSGIQQPAPVQQPRAARRVMQPAGTRGSPPPGATQNQMQPNVIRGQMPPGLTQGQIPSNLTPAQPVPALSPFQQPPDQGDADEGAAEFPQENPFDGGGAQDIPPEENSP